MDENKIITEALDSLIPDNQQKDDIWQRIEACTDVYDLDKTARTEVTAKKSSKKSRSGSMAARIIAVAAAFVLVFGSLAWFSSTTEELPPSLSGYVYAAESRATDMTANEVLVFTGDPAAHKDLDVYAPAIYYLDSDMLIFGNGTGLVIYDLADSRVEGLVDMQAICSGYYNTDTIRTHVLVQDDRLIVYNTKSSGRNLTENAGDDFENTEETPEPWGYYHVFDLSQTGNEAALMECIESGDDKDKIQGFIEAGSAYEHEHLLDAFDHMAYMQSDEMDDIVGYGIGSYSENAFVSGADEKALAKSVLVCRSKDAHSYELCTETGSKGSEPVFTQLNLGITDAMRDEVSELNRLPEYKYNGDDPAIGAICEYLAGEYSRENYAAGRNVAIPAPTIYRQEKVNGELLVFGYFWTDTYCKNGNTLISVSGGALPGCFHLVKDGDTYKIASIDAAEDGERYEESIKKMTEGFPGLYEMYFAGDSIDEKVRKEAINDYVLSNGLGIDYYKDYGWDPVALN